MQRATGDRNKTDNNLTTTTGDIGSAAQARLGREARAWRTGNQDGGSARSDAVHTTTHQTGKER
jgi:hypothetical protein